MDGYAEYSHGSVFNAAWKLAERMPVNERWSRALCLLYDRMQTDAVSIDKPLELAARWHPDPGNVELIEKEAKELERGWLPSYQGVRKGLARLALHNDSKLLASLLASDDPAFRSQHTPMATFLPSRSLPPTIRMANWCSTKLCTTTRYGVPPKGGRH